MITHKDFNLTANFVNNCKKRYLKDSKIKLVDEKEVFNNIITCKVKNETEKILIWDKIQEYNQQITRVSKELSWRRSKNRKSINIEEIKKNVTIASVLGIKEPERDKQLVKCPLHNDKTASFCIYLTTNTFYCFGCLKGGDVITLYMLLNDCDFLTAIKALN